MPYCVYMDRRENYLCGLGFKYHQNGTMTERYKFEYNASHLQEKNFLVGNEARYYSVSEWGPSLPILNYGIVHPKFGKIAMQWPQSNVLYYGENKLLCFESTFDDNVSILDLDETGAVSKVTSITRQKYLTPLLGLEKSPETERRRHVNCPLDTLEYVKFNGILGDFYVRIGTRGKRLLMYALDLRPSIGFIKDHTLAHKWSEFLLFDKKPKNFFFEYEGETLNVVVIKSDEDIGVEMNMWFNDAELMITKQMVTAPATLIPKTDVSSWHNEKRENEPFVCEPAAKKPRV